MTKIGFTLVAIFFISFIGTLITQPITKRNKYVEIEKLHIDNSNPAKRKFYLMVQTDDDTGVQEKSVSWAIYKNFGFGKEIEIAEKETSTKINVVFSITMLCSVISLLFYGMVNILFRDKL